MLVLAPSISKGTFAFALRPHVLTLGSLPVDMDLVLLSGRCSLMILGGGLNVGSWAVDFRCGVQDSAEWGLSIPPERG